jgi:hypothetical protein
LFAVSPATAKRQRTVPGVNRTLLIPLSMLFSLSAISCPGNLHVVPVHSREKVISLSDVAWGVIGLVTTIALLLTFLYLTYRLDQK